jgi:hypothetical protein
MKFFTFSLFLVLSSSLMAQEKWFTDVRMNPEKLRSKSSRSVLFRINREEVKKTFQNSPEMISLEIPMPDGLKTIEFQATDIHAPGFKVLNAAGRDVSEGLEMPLHFKGKNSSRGKELASLSLFSDGNFVLLYSDKKGNVNVAALPTQFEGEADEYVAFLDSDLMKQNPFQCGIDHDGPVPSNSANPSQGTNSVQNDSICRLTEIYWECDFDMFQKGGSIQGTLNQFEAMFTGTAILYEIENINIGVKAVKVWDSPDPYTYTSSFAALDDFQAAGNAANWPGQLAHLLSTRPLNLGGVAYLNAICTDFRYGFSNIDFFFADLPTYSWTLSTIAHELGHNFSSNHTHNCGWEVSPGVFQQIDSCWNAEGGCQPTIKGRVGTIMSYCHLTGSVNLSLGFGTLPGNRIREGYANMPCVAGTIVIPNFTPMNSGPYCVGDTIKLEAEDLPGYSYNWIGPNGFNSSERTPLLPALLENAEGEYSLTVKKLACTSREKKTKLVFNCMQVGSLPATICAGSEITIPMSSTGVFNPDNKFIAQLSNNAGTFSNPINLDTLISSQAQSVRVNLPSNLPMGNAYKIRFLSTSPVYTGKPQTKNLFINPIGPSPTPINGERCGTGSVQISAGGGSGLLWTSSISETVPVFQGRKFNTPVINATTSWFVQSGGTSHAEAGLKSPAGNTTSSQEDGINFSSQGTFRIDSIQLFHGALSSSSALCEVVLKKDGAEIYSRSVAGIAGNSQTIIALFWRVNPGDGYQIICRNIASALKRSAAVFPLKVTNLISLESATSGAADYPYIFNWVISKYSGCPSKKVEVRAKILNGQSPATPAIQSQADSLMCSFQAPSYEWMVNGQVQSSFNFRKIRGLLNSAYQVRYKLDSCWSEWSEPFVVTAVTAANSFINQSVQFYPVPSGGPLSWVGNADLDEISIHSPEGRLIWQKAISGKEILHLNHLADGFYFLSWKSQNASGVQRIAIQH